MRGIHKSYSAISALFRKHGVNDYGLRLTIAVIAEYERTVPSDRLQAILSERRHAVNEIVPTRTLEERAEPRACNKCGRPIESGQAYAVDGPQHIGCRKGT